MYVLIDIAGAYKKKDEFLIVEIYCDLETKEKIYCLYISMFNSNNEETIIEYKWFEDKSEDIKKLLNYLKTEGGSYYDELTEKLFGPNILSINNNISYEIISYNKGFLNNFHEYCFDDVPTTDKDLSLILNELYGTIKYK
jgi:hypothetical protein